MLNTEIAKKLDFMAQGESAIMNKENCQFLKKLYYCKI